MVATDHRHEFAKTLTGSGEKGNPALEVEDVAHDSDLRLREAQVQMAANNGGMPIVSA